MSKLSIGSPINSSFYRSVTQNLIFSPKRHNSNISIQNTIDISIVNPEIKEKTKINLEKTLYINISQFATLSDESNDFIRRDNEDQMLYKKQNLIRKIYLSRNDLKKRRRSQLNITPLKLFDESTNLDIHNSIIKIYKKASSKLKLKREETNYNLLNNNEEIKNDENNINDEIKEENSETQKESERKLKEKEDEEKEKNNKDEDEKYDNNEEEEKKENKNKEIEKENKNGINKKRKKKKKINKENSTCSCVCIIY